MPSEETFEMILNPEIVEAAKLLVFNPSTALPAEIPGFPGLFVATPDDASIDAIGAFVASEGHQFKIGTRSAH